MSDLSVAFIPVGLSEPIKVVQITNKLSSMYPIIGCSMVERVPLHPSYKSNLWVDEEGLLKDQPQVNIRASCIAGQTIYGNAIFAGEKITEDGPEMVSLCIPCPKQYFDMVQKEAEQIIANRVVDRMAEIDQELGLM